MGAMQLPLLSALADKMHWHQARQKLLAENVANADTAGYSEQDLKAYSFEEHLRDASGAQLDMAMTDPGHIALSGDNTDGFAAADPPAFALAPGGNPVNLEDEMMKVTSNQMDYQTITALYTRSLRIIRTALGHQA